MTVVSQMKIFFISSRYILYQLASIRKHAQICDALIDHLFHFSQEEVLKQISISNYFAYCAYSREEGLKQINVKRHVEASSAIGAIQNVRSSSRPVYIRIRISPTLKNEQGG